MKELNFIKAVAKKGDAACCGPKQGVPRSESETSSRTCLPVRAKDRPAWITGSIMTDAGAIPAISTTLARSDHWEHVKCRLSSYRNDYAVAPGLYAAGMPGRNSDVLVSANYKLSFDALRKASKGLNVWVLVLDTRGINVWCAAGKGIFGTNELIRSIFAANLEKVVDHRKIIVPQLGAPGISAHMVKKASGFKVCYGPVRAEDTGAYITAGYKATKEMRTVKFPAIERLILTPMEINPAVKKYYPWYALIILAVFGLQPGKIFSMGSLTDGLPFLLLGLVSILAGALVTPVLLPFIPFRSFAAKGWIAGMLSIFLSEKLIAMHVQMNTVLLIFTYLFFPLASSYIALQFTGASTFTGMSGVKKELKISIPFYIFGIVASLILLLVYKLGEWRLI